MNESLKSKLINLANQVKHLGHDETEEDYGNGMHDGMCYLAYDVVRELWPEEIKE